MSQSYNKSCMFCKGEIVMSDRISGNWLPYDLNGQVHECKKENQTQRTQKKFVDKPLSIEERLVRLERIVLDPRK